MPPPCPSASSTSLRGLLVVGLQLLVGGCKPSTAEFRQDDTVVGRPAQLQASSTFVGVRVHDVGVWADGTVYAQRDDGTFISADQGLNWRPVPRIEPADQRWTPIGAGPKRIWFRSHDGGLLCGRLVNDKWELLRFPVLPEVEVDFASSFVAIGDDRAMYIARLDHGHGRALVLASVSSDGIPAQSLAKLDFAPNSIAASPDGSKVVTCGYTPGYNGKRCASSTRSEPFRTIEKIDDVSSVAWDPGTASFLMLRDARWLHSREPAPVPGSPLRKQELCYLTKEGTLDCRETSPTEEACDIKSFAAAAGEPWLDCSIGQFGSAFTRQGQNAWLTTPSSIGDQIWVTANSAWRLHDDILYRREADSRWQRMFDDRGPPRVTRVRKWQSGTLFLDSWNGDMSGNLIPWASGSDWSAEATLGVVRDVAQSSRGLLMLGGAGGDQGEVRLIYSSNAEPVKADRVGRGLACNGDTCWLVGDSYISRSRDAGVTWRPAERSEDGGATWNSEEDASLAALTRVVQQHNGKALAAFGEGGLVYLSIDEGQRWCRLSPGDGDLELGTIGRDSIYVATRGGKLASYALGMDACRAARMASTIPGNIIDIAVDGDGALFVASDRRTILRSVDSGKTWSTVYEPEGDGYASSAAIRPSAEGLTAWFAPPLETIRLTSSSERLPAPRSITIDGSAPSKTRLAVTFDRPVPATCGLTWRLQREGGAPQTLAIPEPRRSTGALTVEAVADLEPFRIRTEDAVKFMMDVACPYGVGHFSTKNPVTIRSYVDSVREHWQWAAALVASLLWVLALVTLYVFRPYSLYWLHTRFPLRERLATVPAFVSAPIYVVYELVLVSLLARRARVLDAWARRTVANLPPSSGDYVPLPLRIGARSVRARTWKDVAPTIEAAANIRAPVQIVGPGGVGKSSLLRQIVEWLSEGHLGHPAAVVWLDASSDAVLDAESLEAHVAKRLCDEPGRTIPRDFLRTLLKKGRIVLAYDGVSEMSSSARQQLRELGLSLAIQRCIISTREKLSFAHTSAAVMIQPLALDASATTEFLQRLLPHGNHLEASDATAPKRTFADLVIAELGPDASVPALVVWLFAQLANANARTPVAMSEIYFDYVRYHVSKISGLTDERGGLTLNGLSTLKGLRLLADKCIGADGQLRAVEAEILREGEFAPLGAHLDALLGGGLLRRHKLLTTDRISIALDPITEHLAMEYLVLAAESEGTGAAWQHAISRTRNAQLRLMFVRIISMREQLRGLDPKLRAELCASR